MIAWLRARLPASALGWTLAVAWLAAWAIVLGAIAMTLRPMFADTSTIGQHDWDQMESHRQLVVKTIRDFHQFPWWEPYACGGHPNWGGFESGTILVSPWLPVYLTMTLPHALRVEIVGSALLSALGAWLLAGRFTRSPAARALVVAAFAVNGRWTLQIESGHTWHLAYAWTPWAFYLYDRALGDDPGRGPVRARDLGLAGIPIAMMVYSGGIYPLPETAFLVAVYGLLLAAATRSARPLLVGAAAGLAGAGLAAPKLLPVLEVLFAHPRLIDSTETLDLTALVEVLTSPDQDMMSFHAGTSQFGWHEWGMYVGWAIVLASLLGLAFARGARARAVKWVGLAAFALGVGAFAPLSPWSLLHELPVFKSQHVPSRWMYPGILMLAVAAAAATERGLRRARWARAWLELAALPLVAWIAHDVAEISRVAIANMFTTPMPTTPDSVGPFRTEEHVPGSLLYQNEWSPPSLAAILANVATIDCGTFPAYHNYWRDHVNGRTPGMGAWGIGTPQYRGEAYVAERHGTARLATFTPNEITVTVEGARPGDHLVLNQNWDPGWRADGRRTLDWADAVAIELRSGDQTVVFRYRPRLLWPGVALFFVTVGALALAGVGERRSRARAAGAVRPGIVGA